MKIKPFKALRYNENKFKTPPVAPPYDIISEEEREKMASNEYHMINLDKPGSSDDSMRYEKARKRLDEWKRDGILIKEDKPSFYLYEQEFKNPETGDILKRKGFFALLKLEDPYVGCIYPHEKTLSAPKEDRLNLMKATKANLSPVFGLYDDPNDKACGVFDEVIKSSKKIYEDYVDYDGTVHSIWKIDKDEHIKALIDIVETCNMIIADGHHRYATALNYAKLNGSALDGANSFDYVLVDLVNFNDKGLIILPTHRLIKVSFDESEIIRKLAAFFDIKEVTKEDIEKTLLNKGEDESVIGFYIKDKPYLLKLKGNISLNEFIPDSKSNIWKKLEVTILYYIVLKNVFNMSDDEFQKNIGYTHSFGETYSLVDNGKVFGAFLVPPCTKDEIEKVTLDHEVMPQKSTYFFPKIFSGFVIYEH